MFRINGALAILVIAATNAVIECRPDNGVVFVNVVFRHGDRAPDDNGKELYPNDPYLNDSFLPMGLGGLTNEGKLREYYLGLMLRSRYGHFLGKIYVPDDIVARSTDYRRTKMSLSLVLASLYPPARPQVWNVYLNWQPIPTTYVPEVLDVLLVPEECPRYLEELERVKSLPEVVSEVESFRPLMDNLTILTGKSIETTNDMYYLYHTLMAEYSMNLTLPDWAYNIFPSGALLDGTNLEYNIVNYNDQLKKLNGGTLLKRFTDDMVNTIDGKPKGAGKMNLFSGHETNVAAILQTLGVYEPHVPEYGSAVIVELLRIDGHHYVRVLYYRGIPPIAEERIVPGCDVLCPIEDFLELLQNVTPTEDDLECRKKASYPQTS